MARTTNFRTPTMLAAMVTVALVALFALGKPAYGIPIEGGLCLPPYCPPETIMTSKPLEVETSSTATFGFYGTSYWSNPRFECQLDGGGWSACTSPREYTDLSDGSHTFEVRAIDSRSMDYSPASHTWTVYATQPPPPDTTPPRTILTNYPSWISTSTTARFGFTGSDDRTQLADLEFQCRFDSTSEDDWSACTSPREYTDLSDGSHTFEVRAVDPAGNVDPTPESREFSVDTTPPDTTITQHPSDPSNDAFPTFEFTGSDNVYRFECRLLLAGSEETNPAWSTCYSPHRFGSAVPEGTHTFQVRAYDTWYRTDPTPASYTWTHNDPPPPPPELETSITSGPVGTPVTSDAARFEFSANREGVTFECKLDQGSYEACSSPKEYTDLADGEHFFYVRAVDSTGTPDATPSGYGWTIDTTPPPTVPIVPHVVDTDPDNGSTGVARSIKPEVTFDTDLDGDTVNAQNVKLQLYNARKAKWVAVPSTVSYENRVVTVTPADNLGAKKRYQVVFSTNIKSLTDGNLEQPFNLRFTTAR